MRQSLNVHVALGDLSQNIVSMLSIRFTKYVIVSKQDKWTVLGEGGGDLFLLQIAYLS